MENFTELQCGRQEEMDLYSGLDDVLVASFKESDNCQFSDLNCKDKQKCSNENETNKENALVVPESMDLFDELLVAENKKRVEREKQDKIETEMLRKENQELKSINISLQEEARTLNEENGHLKKENVLLKKDLQEALEFKNSLIEDIRNRDILITELRSELDKQKHYSRTSYEDDSHLRGRYRDRRSHKREASSFDHPAVDHRETKKSRHSSNEKGSKAHLSKGSLSNPEHENEIHSYELSSHSVHQQSSVPKLQKSDDVHQKVQQTTESSLQLGSETSEMEPTVGLSHTLPSVCASDEQQETGESRSIVCEAVSDDTSTVVGMQNPVPQVHTQQEVGSEQQASKSFHSTVSSAVPSEIQNALLDFEKKQAIALEALKRAFTDYETNQSNFTGGLKTSVSNFFCQKEQSVHTDMPPPLKSGMLQSKSNKENISSVSSDPCSDHGLQNKITVEEVNDHVQHSEDESDLYCVADATSAEQTSRDVSTNIPSQQQMAVDNTEGKSYSKCINKAEKNTSGSSRKRLPLHDSYDKKCSEKHSSRHKVSRKSPEYCSPLQGLYDTKRLPEVETEDMFCHGSKHRPRMDYTDSRKSNSFHRFEGKSTENTSASQYHSDSQSTWKGNTAKYSSKEWADEHSGSKYKSSPHENNSPRFAAQEIKTLYQKRVIERINNELKSRNPSPASSSQVKNDTSHEEGTPVSHRHQRYRSPYRYRSPLKLNHRFKSTHYLKTRKDRLYKLHKMTRSPHRTPEKIPTPLKSDAMKLFTYQNLPVPFALKRKLGLLKKREEEEEPSQSNMNVKESTVTTHVQKPLGQSAGKQLLEGGKQMDEKYKNATAEARQKCKSSSANKGCNDLSRKEQVQETDRSTNETGCDASTLRTLKEDKKSLGLRPEVTADEGVKERTAALDIKMLKRNSSSLNPKSTSEASLQTKQNNAKEVQNLPAVKASQELKNCSVNLKEGSVNTLEEHDRSKSERASQGKKTAQVEQNKEFLKKSVNRKKAFAKRPDDLPVSKALEPNEVTINATTVKSYSSDELVKKQPNSSKDSELPECLVQKNVKNTKKNLDKSSSNIKRKVKVRGNLIQKENSPSNTKKDMPGLSPTGKVQENMPDSIKVSLTDSLDQLMSETVEEESVCTVKTGGTRESRLLAGNVSHAQSNTKVQEVVQTANNDAVEKHGSNCMTKGNASELILEVIAEQHEDYEIQKRTEADMSESRVLEDGECSDQSMSECEELDKYKQDCTEMKEMSSVSAGRSVTGGNGKQPLAHKIRMKKKVHDKSFKEKTLVKKQVQPVHEPSGKTEKTVTEDQTVKKFQSVETMGILFNVTAECGESSSLVNHHKEPSPEPSQKDHCHFIAITELKDDITAASINHEQNMVGESNALSVCGQEVDAAVTASADSDLCANSQMLESNSFSRQLPFTCTDGGRLQESTENVSEQVKFTSKEMHQDYNLSVKEKNDRAEPVEEIPGIQGSNTLVTAKGLEHKPSETVQWSSVVDCTDEVLKSQKTDFMQNQQHTINEGRSQKESLGTTALQKLGGGTHSYADRQKKPEQSANRAMQKHEETLANRESVQEIPVVPADDVQQGHKGTVVGALLQAEELPQNHGPSESAMNHDNGQHEPTVARSVQKKVNGTGDDANTKDSDTLTPSARKVNDFKFRMKQLLRPESSKSKKKNKHKFSLRKMNVNRIMSETSMSEAEQSDNCTDVKGTVLNQNFDSSVIGVSQRHHNLAADVLYSSDTLSEKIICEKERTQPCSVEETFKPSSSMISTPASKTVCSDVPSVLQVSSAEACGENITGKRTPTYKRIRLYCYDDDDDDDDS